MMGKKENYREKYYNTEGLNHKPQISKSDHILTTVHITTTLLMLMSGLDLGYQRIDQWSGHLTSVVTAQLSLKAAAKAQL